MSASIVPRILRNLTIINLSSNVALLSDLRKASPSLTPLVGQLSEMPPIDFAHGFDAAMTTCRRDDPAPMSMRMKMIAIVAALAASATTAGSPPYAPATRSWSSADGRVRLEIPAIVEPSTSQGELSGGVGGGAWRLSGRHEVRGTMAIRLTLPVVPSSASQARATEVLQVGWSAAPSAVRTCLAPGAAAGTITRLPARSINGVRFAAMNDSRDGMNQSLEGLDLRAVVRGRCYAVARVTVSAAAGVADPDSRVTLPQKQGAAMLDAALASLRLGTSASTTVPTARRLPH